MKLKSVLLHGPVSKKLSYKLCLSDPSIRRGIWEIAIASVSFYFSSDVNRIVSLKSNIVQDQEFSDKRGQLEAISVVLSVMTCSGKKGSSKTIYMTNQNFFEINALHDSLDLSFQNIKTGNKIKGAVAFCPNKTKNKNNVQ